LWQYYKGHMHFLSFNIIALNNDSVPNWQTWQPSRHLLLCIFYATTGMKNNNESNKSEQIIKIMLMKGTPHYHFITAHKKHSAV